MRLSHFGPTFRNDTLYSKRESKQGKVSTHARKWLSPAWGLGERHISGVGRNFGPGPFSRRKREQIGSKPGFRGVMGRGVSPKSRWWIGSWEKRISAWGQAEMGVVGADLALAAVGR